MSRKCERRDVSDSSSRAEGGGHGVGAYVLIRVRVGKAKAVVDTFARLSSPGIRCASADAVIGPHDVIIRVEADNLERLSAAVSAIQRDLDVERVVTCFCVRLASGPVTT